MTKHLLFPFASYSICMAVLFCSVAVSCILTSPAVECWTRFAALGTISFHLYGQQQKQFCLSTQFYLNFCNIHLSVCVSSADKADTSVNAAHLQQNIHMCLNVFSSTLNHTSTTMLQQTSLLRCWQQSILTNTQIICKRNKFKPISI